METQLPLNMSRLTYAKQANALDAMAAELEKVRGQTEVKMSESMSDLNVADDYHACGSPACVGGYLLAVSLKGENVPKSGRDYFEGLEVFIDALGYQNFSEFAEFFSRSKEGQAIWGNRWAGDCFGGENAWLEQGVYNPADIFAKLDIKHVAKKLRNVAARMRDAIARGKLDTGFDKAA